MKNLIGTAFLLGFLVLSCKKHEFYKGEEHSPAPASEHSVIVVNGGSNSLSFFQLNDSVPYQTRQLSGATFPHHIYLSPDQSMYAIAFVGQDLSGGHEHHGGGSSYMVQVFERITGAHIRNIKLELPTHNAIFAPDGASLWIGQSDEISKVCVYDTKKWKLKSEIEVGNGLSEITFSADGSKAYATNTTAGSVSIIDVANRQVVGTLQVGLTPVGAWQGRNGKMYVDCEGSKTVVEIDVKNNEISSVISLGFKPGYVAYNALKKQLWVTDATNGAVVVFEKSGTNWVKVKSIKTGSDAHAIAFSRNDSTAFVTNQGAGTVSQFYVPDLQIVKNITVGEKPNGLVIIE